MVHAAQTRDQGGRDFLQLAERHRGLVILTIIDSVLEDIVNKIVQSLGCRPLQTLSLIHI